MAISFPRDFLPGYRFVEQPSFELSYGTSINRVGSGALQVMEVADPLWEAQFVVEPMRWSGRQAWQAWAMTQRGGIFGFYGYDPFRQYPAAYGGAVMDLTRHGGGAFTGGCTLVSNTATSVTLSALPSTYQATAGDMVSLLYVNGQRGLHVVTEDAVASAGVITVSVEPPVRSGALTTALLTHVVRATCVMTIKPGSFQAPAGVGKRSVSFEAIQVLP